MTLMFHLHLNIMKMYLSTKMKFAGQGIQKLRVRTGHDRQTRTHDRTYYHAAFADGKYMQ